MKRRTLSVLFLLAVSVILGNKTASACWWARPSTAYYVSASPCYCCAPTCWSYCCNPCCSRVYYYNPCSCCYSSCYWTQGVVTGSQAATSGCSNCKPATDVKPGAKLQPTPQPNPVH
jgi:hypothetical protein